MYTDREIVEASLPGNMTSITDVLLKKALFAERFTPLKVRELLIRIEELETYNEQLKKDIKEIGQAVDSLDKTSKDHIDRLRKRGIIK